MRLTIVFEDEVVPLEVGEEMELENLMALIRLEIATIEPIPNDQLVLMLGIRRIALGPDTLKMSLHQHGFQDQDALNVLSADRRRETPLTRSRVQSVGTQQQSAMREMIAGLVSQIKVPAKKPEGADREGRNSASSRASSSTS
ncbi:hypothetical protein M3Y99_01858800 [Aphelenchoides fujianensis]|nr:hypothetical protein M3Y99_01858800 [Aphelenchoides fujianensis]